MKLTLKERLDLQRTARIITESQYKKLLKESEFISGADAKKQHEIVVDTKNELKKDKELEPYIKMDDNSMAFMLPLNLFSGKFTDIISKKINKPKDDIIKAFEEVGLITKNTGSPVDLSKIAGYKLFIPGGEQNGADVYKGRFGENCHELIDNMLKKLK